MAVGGKGSGVKGHRKYRKHRSDGRDGEKRAAMMQ